MKTGVVFFRSFASASHVQKATGVQRVQLLKRSVRLKRRKSTPPSPRHKHRANSTYNSKVVNTFCQRLVQFDRPSVSFDNMLGYSNNDWKRNVKKRNRNWRRRLRRERTGETSHSRPPRTLTNGSGETLSRRRTSQKSSTILKGTVTKGVVGSNSSCIIEAVEANIDVRAVADRIEFLIKGVKRVILAWL